MFDISINNPISDTANRAINEMHSAAALLKPLTKDFTLSFDDIRYDLPLLITVMRWVFQYNEGCAVLNSLGLGKTRNILSRLMPEAAAYADAFIGDLNEEKDSAIERIKSIYEAVQKREDSYSVPTGYAA